jgi:hypothetical protein
MPFVSVLIESSFLAIPMRALISQLTIIGPLLMVLIAQVETILHAANEGATLGGQGILLLIVIGLCYAVVSMNKAARAAAADILTSTERQRSSDHAHHIEVVTAFRLERDIYRNNEDKNFGVLLQIAAESAKALEATSIAIQAQVVATNSLRDTLHGIRNELQAHHAERDLRR